MASMELTLAAVEKALAEYKPSTVVMDDWLEQYEEWLDRGKKHSIGGHGGDCTQERRAHNRGDQDSAWDDFLQDYSEENEATYISGAGLRWKTYGELYTDEYEAAVREDVHDYLAVVFEQPHLDFIDSHDKIRDAVEFAISDEPVKPPAGWRHTRAKYLARKYTAQIAKALDTGEVEDVDVDEAKEVLKELHPADLCYTDLAMAIDQALEGQHEQP